MSRVVIYVDGFNLYFGLRSRGWRRYFWLDMRALAMALLKPEQKLQRVHYFTARIRSDGRNAADMKRQICYLEALATLPDLHLHFGHYLEKPRSCRACGSHWMDYEEKMTDVNIAVQMLVDAFDDRFDTALLISGDSDLTTPVRSLRDKFPAKRIVVAFPPDRYSHELRKAANAWFTLGEANLRKSQFPATVLRPMASCFAVRSAGTERTIRIELGELPIKTPRKLIEVALPLDAINEAESINAVWQAPRRRHLQSTALRFCSPPRPAFVRHARWPPRRPAREL